MALPAVPEQRATHIAYSQAHDPYPASAIRSLIESRLFDSEYYAKCIEGLCDGPPMGNPEALISHYFSTGWKLGASPSLQFSGDLYLFAYPDVKHANMNPLLHYVTSGQKEGRIIFTDNTEVTVDIGPVDRNLYILIRNSGLFDEEYYCSYYRDVVGAGMDPLFHYMHFGSKENRNPSIWFDTDFYGRATAMMRNPGMLPLEHYIRLGCTSQLPPRPTHSIEFSGVTDDAYELSSRAPSPSIAIHAHLHYASIGIEIIAAIAKLELNCAIFLTTGSELDAYFYDKYIETFHNNIFATTEIVVFPNVGRDIAPLIVGMAEHWRKYDLWCHVHTKYSQHTAFGHRWRAHMLDGILGNADRVNKIRDMFADPTLGLVFCDHYFEIKRFIDIGKNELVVKDLISLLGLKGGSSIDDFPAGSFFWARKEALEPLFAACLDLDAFPAEAAQLDGTLAHAIERTFPMIVQGAGLKVGRLYALPADADGVHQYRTAPADETDEVGVRWMRDTPKIYAERPIPLSPTLPTYDTTHILIHWIIPDFGQGAGGHMTIFRFVSELSHRGHHQVVWIQNCRNHANPAQARRNIEQWYRPLNDNVFVRFLPDDVRGISGDVLIVTDCWTAFPGAQMCDFKHRFYFIQDYEPFFHPVGDLFYTALNTYNFGFTGLCAGRWLSSLAVRHNMRTYTWELAVDHKIYNMAKLPTPTSGRPIIAFYARQYTPRRLVGLGMAGLDILARRGMDFSVVFFGEELQLGEKNYPYISVGIATPESLALLYRLSTVGLVMSGTNCSLVPFEMMACGLPVVDVAVESTQTVYPEGSAALTPPTPPDLADTLQQMLRDKGYRSKIAETGYIFSRSLDWNDSVDIVESAIRTELSRAWRPRKELVFSPTNRTKPVTASIFIPTLNAGVLFDKVLARVISQKTSFNYDIVIIDSSSDDGTFEKVKKLSRSHPSIKSIQIAKSEFQHGKTRDLGIEMARGQYVALVTQDALPEHDYWLDNLVNAVDSAPQCAFAFGRHKAYEEHSCFVAADIKEMFDWFDCEGPEFSQNMPIPSLRMRGLTSWQMRLYYNSDNNTCVNKKIWEAIRYPHVNWGEDQVWAKMCMESGFHKMYVDTAVVWHSHELDALSQYNVGVEEGWLFRNYLGIDIGGRREGLYAKYLQLCRRDINRFPSVPMPFARHVGHIGSVLGRFAGTVGKRDLFTGIMAMLDEAVKESDLTDLGDRFKTLLEGPSTEIPRNVALV